MFIVRTHIGLCAHNRVPRRIPLPRPAHAVLSFRAHLRRVPSAPRPGATDYAGPRPKLAEKVSGFRSHFGSNLFSRRSCAGCMETFASHLPSESSDDDEDGLLSRAREVIASESTDGSSYSESEDSLDLRKFSGNGETTAFTVADLPPESSVSEVEGHGLPEDDADGEFAGGWSPGQNAGSWVGRTSPLTEQGQVLVANVYLKTKRLASDVLAALAQAVGRRGTESRPLRVASALLGISRVMVSRCVQILRQREWVPRAVASAEGKVTALPAHLQGDAQSDDAQLRVLRTLVRAALSLGDDGYISYTRSVARMALAGVEVGNRYHGRHFAKEAVFLAARCVQVLHARSLRAPLPGLGISSSLALLMDGVPVGGVSLYGRHGSVIVLCVNSVSSEDGRLRPHMISWVLPTGGHGGEAVASSVLAALAATPAGLDGAALKGRLSLVGGDGATVLGGAARKAQALRPQRFFGARCTGSSLILSATWAMMFCSATKWIDL